MTFGQLNNAVEYTHSAFSWDINLMLCDNEMVDDVGGYEGVTTKCIEPEYRTAWIEPYKRHFLKKMTLFSHLQSLRSFKAARPIEAMIGVSKAS